MSRQKGNTRRTYFPVRVRIHKKGKGAWTHGAPKLFEKRGHSDGNRPAAACRRHVLPHLYRGAYRRRGHGPVPVDLHGLHNGRHLGYGGAFGGGHASFGGTAGHRRPRPMCAQPCAAHWRWGLGLARLRPRCCSLERGLQRTGGWRMRGPRSRCAFWRPVCRLWRFRHVCGGFSWRGARWGRIPAHRSSSRSCASAWWRCSLILPYRRASERPARPWSWAIRSARLRAGYIWNGATGVS